MKNPFPGMNPWLENPVLWSDVHFRLIAAVARYLSPLISPRYYISIETQAYIMTQTEQPPGIRYPDMAVVRAVSSSDAIQEGGMQGGGVTVAEPASPITVQIPVPDIIEETFLEIRETETRQIITVIEVLSPANKRPGAGRQKYERKRLEILGTHTHLVEIDLLRTWKPMPMVADMLPCHYRIVVRREEQGNTANLYAFNMQDRIPEFPLPLQEGDEEPVINLKRLLDEIYVEARYDLRINYQQPPIPRLSAEEARWAAEILEKHTS